MNSRFCFLQPMLVAAVLSHSVVSWADEVVVFSTTAAKSAVELIVPEFERATGHRVQTKFGTAAELKGFIEKGASCDVALLTAGAVDDLIKGARLNASSRAVIFKSGVGIAGKVGVPAPPVSTAEELKAALLAAKAIGLSTQGASGSVMKRAFETLGIADIMATKTLFLGGATPVAEAVVAGRAELAFTQISEILDTPGALLLGPLPAPLQSYSTFIAASASDTKVPVAATSFLASLSSASAKVHMRTKGLQPE